MKRILLLLTLLLVLPLAHAVKPDVSTDEYGFTMSIVDRGTYTVWDNVWQTEKVKDFYDKNGNFIRSQIHYTVQDDLYKGDDDEIDLGGPHLYGYANLNYKFYYDENGDGIAVLSGNIMSITVPGYGALVKDAGRLIFSESTGWKIVFSAGNCHDLNFGELQALCDYYDEH